MNAPPVIELVSRRCGPPRAYAIAGVKLVTDVDHPALATYALDEPAVWSGPIAPPSEPSPAITFDGEGLIGDDVHHVVCREGAAGYELKAEGLGTYHVGRDGRIYETAAGEGIAPELLSATALGAPLILALALRGIFCIHASAAAYGEGLVAFIGESGQGKSTLARYLGREGGPAWRRVIDDTLPLAPASGEAAIARPHFPQLKLLDDMQPSRLVPAEMPLRGVYLLEDGQWPTITPLRRSEATLALAAQTVGARLFGRSLLAEHLDHCADLVRRLPVRRLTYPRNFEALPAVRERISANLLNDVGQATE